MSDIEPKRPDINELDGILSPLGKTQPNSLARNAALSVIQNGRADNVSKLFSPLLAPNGSDWFELETSAWVLGVFEHTTEVRDSVLSTLMEILESRFGFRTFLRHLRTVFFGSIALGLIWCVMCFVTGTSLRIVWTEEWFVFSNIVFVFMSISYLPLLLSRERKGFSQVRARAAWALGQMRSPDSLGTLSTCLGDGDQRVRIAASEALHQVLPTITEEHIGRVGSTTIVSLARALSHSDTQLVMKILDVLDKVGSSHAVPYVRAIVEKGRTLRVRDAAQAVLTTLEARQRQEASKDKLLRPSASQASAENLLRPASATETDPNFLLRVASADEN